LDVSRVWASSSFVTLANRRLCKMVVVRAATESQPRPKVKTTNVLLLLLLLFDVADVDTSNNSSNIAPPSSVDHSRIPKCKDSGSQEGRPTASSPARSINPEIQIHSRLVMARVLFLLPSYGNLSQ